MIPKVSVFIPVYNTEKYIAATIQCVLDQSFQDFELVIVDDASADTTFEICRTFAAKDKRIKLYRNEKNLGMMPNWIHGIPFCTGEYWGKLDADDIWHADFLRQCVTVLDQRPDVGMVISGFELMDENNRLIEGSRYRLPEYARDASFSMLEQKLSKGIALFEDRATQQGIGLLRRSVFKDFGTFTLLPAGDSEMWFRIGAHYNLYGIDACMHQHRIWSQSFTRTEVLGMNKLDKNLCEVRKVIFDYYYQQKLITPEQYKAFSSDNDFQMGKYIVASSLHNRAYLKAVSRLVYNFFTWPEKTSKFYYNRIGEKLNKNK